MAFPQGWLMSFLSLFNRPFYTGAPATELTPFPYDISIDGHPYMVSTDPAANEKWGVRFQQTSNPLLRDQTDQSDQPGEQSLSPNQLWRRSVESWHLGAGQKRYDRKTSSPYRFNTSVGVDVWTEGELSLLDGVLSAPFGAGVGSASACVAGSRYYYGSATNLYYSTDISPTTGVRNTVTGTPAATLLSLATDGTNVFGAFGASGIYKTTTTTTAATSYSTGATVTLVGYYKGRLMCADNAGKIYNPIATGALPASLLDLSARGWTWTAFGEGPNAIYAAGFSGDQSLIYNITVKPDGTGLTVPLVAATLPTGEIARSVYGYLGYVVVGTDKGVRFCNPDSSGNLTLGGLIPTTAPVYKFVGQDRFVWFTWSQYDSFSGGLGRMDLSQFTTDLTPAYASDLMQTFVTPTSVIVRNVDVFNSKLVFTAEVTSVTGIFCQDPTTTAYQSSIDTGTIGFGIGDPKAAVFVDIRHDPLPTLSTVQVNLAVDQGPFESLGSSVQPGSTGEGRPFSANQVTGETFSLQLLLDPVNHGGLSPVIHRITLRAYPQATRISEFSVPIIMHTNLRPSAEAEYFCDVEYERDYLTTLWRSQRIVTYQEGNISTLVAVSDFEWLPEKKTSDDTTFQGTYVAHLREVLA